MTNWLAVLVAAVVSFLAGWAWYSNTLFGQAWRRLSGITEEMHMQWVAEGKGKMGKTMSLFFLALLVQAYVLSQVLVYMGAFGALDGVRLGFWMWLGFAVPASIGMVLWDRRPWKRYFIDGGYLLLVLLISGVILVVWR
jgi:hypothetical protein